MFRGMYGAAAGMIVQQQRQEMLTNNIANANTPGYKADQASIRSFPNMLMHALDTQKQQQKNGGALQIGGLSTGVYLQERTPTFIQGSLQETGLSTDLALIQGRLPETNTGRSGALFFTIQNEAGDVRYSRNGNFTVDGEGYLTTMAGNYVLDLNGNPITVFNDSFRVHENGTITTEDGDVIAQVNVAYVEDPALLVKEENGLFRYTGEGAVPSAIGNDDITYSIRQQFIERSNVDVAQTMAEMMSAYRTFEANQRVLQAYDQSMEKAVNEIGRIS